MSVKFIIAKSPLKALQTFARNKSLLTRDTLEDAKELLKPLEEADESYSRTNDPWVIYKVSQDVGQKPTCTPVYTQRV